MPLGSNILLLIADQLRADCVSPSEHPVRMPHVERLAREGVRFDRAYSASALCAPARRTLASGQRPHRHGVLDEHWKTPLVGATLSRILAGQDYRTHLVGKLHLWPSWRAHGYQSAEWSDWVDPHGGGDYREFVRTRAGDAPWIDGEHDFNQNSRAVRRWALPEALHFTNWCADSALRFLESRNASQAFLLTVSFIAPHPPLFPLPKFLEKYAALPTRQPLESEWSRELGETLPDGRTATFWRGRLDPDSMHLLRAAYYACIEHLDEQIGRILQDVPDDTLVIFLSDHGDMLGDHCLFQKRAPYESSARVPMIIRPPRGTGFERAGSSSDVAVELMDVMPTVLDYLDLPIPTSVDGLSLMPLMRGDSLTRRFIHGENAKLPPMRSSMHFVTDGRWKYIWYPQRDREQLFCLESDAYEAHDLRGAPLARDALENLRYAMWKALSDRSELGYGARLRSQIS